MDIEAFCSQMRKDAEVVSKAENLIASGNKWAGFRVIYEHITPKVMSGEGYDPYMVDWSRLMTPIEQDAWQTIRGTGIPMHPQYPVGKFFVDFGDPVKKVAIECDGKDWHTEEKDSARDACLISLGWTVYRVKGSECIKPGLDFCLLRERYLDEQISRTEYEEAINAWATGSSDGLIEAIACFHYGKQAHQDKRGHLYESLEMHRSAI